MRLLRSALALVATLSFLCPANAQEQKNFFARTLDRILAPSRALDPNAIYVPAPRWTVALTGDVRQASFSQKQESSLPSARLSPSGELIIEMIPVSICADLQGKVDKGLGVQVGYGDLSLSLSKNFGGEGNDRVFSFDYQSAGFALQAQFFGYSNPVRYHQTFAEEGHWAHWDDDRMTEKPGRLRTLLLDSFYAFNQRSFAYSAAYRGNLFQKRSAGSWMFGGKLILGEYRIDPQEEMASWMNGQARNTTAQVMLGGGYSYNLVPFHRQPYGERDKGLRNLTLNVTFLPMVTFFNQFTSTAYNDFEDGVYQQVDKVVMNGRLQVNYVARIGIGYTHNLFSVNLSASNNDYSYRGVSAITYGGYQGSEVKTEGAFFRWATTLRLGMRF